MELSEKQIRTLGFVTQGVGAIFVGIFLAAYLGGLPSTVVLHSEPAFRIPLFAFGSAFLILILTSVVISFFSKKE